MLIVGGLGSRPAGGALWVPGEWALGEPGDAAAVVVVMAEGLLSGQGAIAYLRTRAEVEVLEAERAHQGATPS